MIEVKTKFVAVSTFTIAPENITSFSEAARAVMEHDLPTVEGLCEGAVMTDPERTTVLIVTQWDSQHSWARANYEPRIGAAVAGFVQGAMHYDVHTYEPITIVRSTR